MTRPAPEVGHIVLFDYLWAREAAQGDHEGRKDRPCAVVLAVAKAPPDGAPWVVLAPITHSPPHGPDDAVALPQGARAGTGLDDLPSWIVVTEANYVAWSDPRLRPSRDGRWLLGRLSRGLAMRVAEAIKARLRTRSLRLVTRP